MLISHSVSYWIRSRMQSRSDLNHHVDSPISFRSESCLPPHLPPSHPAAPSLSSAFAISFAGIRPLYSQIKLMGIESDLKVVPKVVTLDKALKLAEAWVDSMSRSTTTESTELEFVGRPSRVGLGAKVTPNAKAVESTDPLERKLLKKLNIDKRQSSKNLGQVRSAENSGFIDEDDDEPESRTSAFAKKRAMPQPKSLQSTKRSK